MWESGCDYAESHRGFVSAWKKADLKAESQNLEQIRNYAKQLSQLGPKTVIITGVSQGEKSGISDILQRKTAF